MSDPEGYRRALSVTNRRHDVIAVDLNDPLDSEISNVGLLALEDPESGDIVWVDTGSSRWQDAYQQQMQQLENSKTRIFRQASVDRIDIHTDQEYAVPLTRFFQDRAKRIRH
jgi:hypothetical protein